MTEGRRTISYRARRVHRFLGLFIGIQFLLWTIGGLYFSWVDLDEVHGDHLQAPSPRPAGALSLVSPTVVLERVGAEEPVDSIVGLDLIAMQGRPTYRLTYFTHSESGPARRVRLADAESGALRPALQREQAVAIARAAFRPGGAIQSVEYLTAENVGAHHEYREQPLPAWAITFQHPSAPTAYVAADFGQLIRIRNGKWRAFDFLWMLHTMDYQGRDNINNWVLRAFSLLGLATVGSGFLLFWLTSRTYLNRRKRLASPRPGASV